jgi:hypothetical protein
MLIGFAFVIGTCAVEERQRASRFARYSKCMEQKHAVHEQAERELEALIKREFPDGGVLFSDPISTSYAFDMQCTWILGSDQ